VSLSDSKELDRLQTVESGTPAAGIIPAAFFVRSGDWKAKGCPDPIPVTSRCSESLNHRRDFGMLKGVVVEKAARNRGCNGALDSADQPRL
jgi:hypothetical protein